MPEYLIMVRLWEEGKKLEGHVHAQPVFDALNVYLQDYLRVQPKLAE